MLGVGDLYLVIQNLLMLMKENGTLKKRRMSRSKIRVSLGLPQVCSKWQGVGEDKTFPPLSQA